MGREESSGRSPIKLKNSLNKFRVISGGNGRYICRLCRTGYIERRCVRIDKFQIFINLYFLFREEDVFEDNSNTET